MVSGNLGLFCLTAAVLCVSKCFTKPATNAPVYSRGLPKTAALGGASKDTTALTASGIDQDDLNKNTIGVRSRKRLFNRNSGHFIRINKTGNVDGMGLKSDANAMLLLETVGFGEITIKSYKWGTYLCLSNNGTVVSMPLPTGKAQVQCIFYEMQPSVGYTVYKSMFNTNWYLAITKDGQPKNGKKTSSQQRATHFLDYRVKSQKGTT